MARQAAQLATTHGLDGITIGGLAADLGVSKSGILTVFPTREAIQLAAVAQARQIYLETVVGPAWTEPPGLPRLRALLTAWRNYLLGGVFVGGCFISATSAEYGHRQGPVADAVRDLKREWLQLLQEQLTAAGSTDPSLDAFRLDAYLSAGNQRRELFGDDAQVDTAYRLAGDVLARLERAD